MIDILKQIVISLTALVMSLQASVAGLPNNSNMAAVGQVLGASDLTTQDINLASGHSYTVSGSASGSDSQYEAKYSDSNNKLTDGVYGTNLQWGLFVGYLRGNQRTITIDLGSNNTVHQLSAHFLQDLAAGIYVPPSVTFESSSDGVNWAPLGTVNTNTANSVAQAVEDFVLSGLNANARYVRLNIPINVWVFIDEIKILGRTSSTPSTPPPVIPSNLALSKPYSLTVPYPDPGWQQYEQSWPDIGNRLTDGKYAPLPFVDGFVGYLRGDYRRIIVDLGSNSTLDKLNANFLQDVSMAVYIPESVTFYVSLDKNNWYKAGTVTRKAAENAQTRQAEKFELTNLNLSGRYVLVEFPVDAWTFIDEIQAIGVGSSLGVLGGAIPLLPPGTNLGYLQPAKTSGGDSHNQVLIYGGYTSNNITQWTADDFKPYVTYVDSQNISQAPLFSSFLFIPVAQAPSGRSYYPYDNVQPSNKTDWEWYLDNTFQSGYQLDALNNAVLVARTKLNSPNLTANVVLTVPYPSAEQSNFGDINNDGKSENFNDKQIGAVAGDQRIAAVKWYIDEVIRRWNLKVYPGLHLSGFYWYNEAILRNNTTENKVITATATYIHQKNLKFSWIPASFSETYRHAYTFGFDEVTMQPNYMFHSTTAVRLSNTASLARRYGMGTEIELDDMVLEKTSNGQATRQKFFDYLDYGVSENYISSFTTWYQQVKSLLQASRSTDPEIRQVYDRTYNWIQQARLLGTFSDITAPSTPTNLSTTTISASQINLSWSASTDNVGVTGYKVYRGGTLLTTLGNVTTYSNTGLSVSTNYSYTVSAYDAAGNTSSQSTSKSATTQSSTPIVGDFNSDGLVNSIDLSLMTTAWNTNNATYDLNRDTIVNSLDYVIMVQNWSL